MEDFVFAWIDSDSGERYPVMVSEYIEVLEEKLAECLSRPDNLLRRDMLINCTVRRAQKSARRPEPRLPDPGREQRKTQPPKKTGFRFTKGRI